LFKHFKLIFGDMKEYSQAIAEYPQEGFAAAYLALYHKNSDKQAVYT